MNDQINLSEDRALELFNQGADVLQSQIRIKDKGVIIQFSVIGKGECIANVDNKITAALKPEVVSDIHTRFVGSKNMILKPRIVKGI